jgi:nitrogen-specific signal transduction histidine kinase
MSRAIASQKNYLDIEEAYLAGLMHDVGLLLLLGSQSERYGDILQLSVDECVLSDMERQIIGTDHAAVGAWLVDHWKLPSFMSDAILFHHKPLDEIADADSLSQIVWSSHIISAYNEKLDLTHIEHVPELAAVRSMLGIDIAEMAIIRDQAFEQVAVLAAALGVAESADAGVLPVPAVPLELCRSRRSNSDPILSHLDEMVRDMALMQILQRDMFSLCGEEEIFLAVRESAKILFGLGRLAFLLIDPEKSILSGANFSGQSVLLRRLKIRLDPAGSLAAAVALGEQPYSTFDKDRPVVSSLVDVQIGHILDSEGVVYVPMRVRGRHVGVMAYGVSVQQHFRIQKRLAWMTDFAHLAAVSVDAWQEIQNREKEIEADTMSRFALQARRIAHEAGNPLGIIKNYLKIVTRKIPEESGVIQELDILREEIDRVAHILQRLNSLNDASPASGTVNINSVIEGMLSLYGASLFTERGITVEKALDPSLSPITGDRDSIKQILLNIWKNAAEAMSAGGFMVISTRDSIIKEGRHFVEIRLSDSGPGLPPDVMQRLFQPLEPNRRPDHSGIGLSIVANLVERLKGHIECQSAAGQGTAFTILLPRATGNEQ